MAFQRAAADTHVPQTEFGRRTCNSDAPFLSVAGTTTNKVSGPGDFHARAICWFMGMLEIRKILNLKLGYRREDLSAMQRSFFGEDASEVPL